MEQIQCACGCEQYRPKYDSRGRARKYISGHQNKQKSKKQRDAARATLRRIRPKVPWNKGKTYTHASKKVYANKGSWNEAMRRLYSDACMRCGWHKCTCDTHHIIPRSNGGQYSIANGVILCPNCHRLADFGLITADQLRTIKQGAALIGESI